MTSDDVEFFWFNTSRNYRIRLKHPQSADETLYVVVSRDRGIIETFSSNDPKIAWLNDEQCEDLVRRIREERIWGSR